jgi:ketosteroid isomerase-like protein
MTSAADTIAAGIMAKWAAAFSRLDADALSSLYSKNAFFFGSNPKLYRGCEEVKAYFDQLPRWEAPSVRFSDMRTQAAGDALVNMAAIASFVFGKDDTLTVKITWVIVSEDDGWKIVSHHVSATAPLI